MRLTGWHPRVSEICSAGFLSISWTGGFHGHNDTGFSSKRLRRSLPSAARMTMILNETKAHILKT
jgi:hypothetical protein